MAGGCLCGTIAYEIRLPFLRFVNCHCSRCRRVSGSPHAANAVVTPEAFCWTRGSDDVRRFDLSEARSFSVAFCGVCGSQLPHATRSGREVIVPCGGLDADPGQKPSAQVQWSSRALDRGRGRLADRGVRRQSTLTRVLHGF